MSCSNPFHSKTLRVLSANSREEKKFQRCKKRRVFFLARKKFIGLSSHTFFFFLLLPLRQGLLPTLFSQISIFSFYFLQTGNFFSSSVLQLCRRRKMAIDIEEKEGRKFNFRDVVFEAKWFPFASGILVFCWRGVKWREFFYFHVFCSFPHKKSLEKIPKWASRANFVSRSPQFSCFFRLPPPSHLPFP